MKEKNKGKLIKIYEMMYKLLIKRNINEDRYIILLSQINKKGFKTYHINKIDTNLKLLKKCKFGRAHKYTLLLHIRDTYYKTIISIKNNLQFIKNIIDKNDGSLNDKCLDIIKIFNNKTEIIRSFKLADSKFNKSKEYITKYEFINRLKLLLNHYTLLDLKFYGVKLVSLKDLYDYSEYDIRNYYNDTINIIHKSLQDLTDTFEKYISINNNYINFCLISLKSKKYPPKNKLSHKLKKN
jgi:hypothetical protein